MNIITSFLENITRPENEYHIVGEGILINNTVYKKLCKSPEISYIKEYSPPGKYEITLNFSDPLGLQEYINGDARKIGLRFRNGTRTVNVCATVVEINTGSLLYDDNSIEMKVLTDIVSWIISRKRDAVLRKYEYNYNR